MTQPTTATASNGTVVYTLGDGSTLYTTTGSVPIRDNNPGDIKVQGGQIGSDDTRVNGIFGTYATRAAGIQALTDKRNGVRVDFLSVRR